MPKERASPPSPPETNNSNGNGNAKPSLNMPAPDSPRPVNHPGYIPRPDPGEKPIGFLRMMVILISSHIGVRSRANREEDFRRANGLHVFIAAVVYFVLIVGALIVLVNIITSR
ncbi:DUF2970 domain-containing protein [Haliea sp. E1-2-M8]|uniref:DUF2970 domain-containing protein n=1 Tax=Haliea sp. E1-2-M8 TaxID=3064706 RepID=UPI002727ED65|nr:DUF2970 domain-containing protein [Haliea sp. E1-2-M8]MDO8863691.1 DUF2970 domain-containing protein [Haliea sp. E1-2-M8]